MSSKHPPRKRVDYPGGLLFLYGDADAGKLALLSAGFPDDHEVMIPFASRLAQEGGVLVGVTCLPGYYDKKDGPWIAEKPDGYTFDEMANALREAVKALRKESTCPGRARLTGIFHDWAVGPGCIMTNRAAIDEHADAPDELVLFDVLGGPHPDHTDNPTAPDSTWYEQFVTFYYTALLAFCFVLQRYVARLLAGLWLILGSISMKLFRLEPTRKMDAAIIEGREVPLSFFHMMYMCYPYWNRYKAVLRGSSWTVPEVTLPKDLKSVPVLYLYGTCKNIMFHDYVALKILEREHREGRSKSNAIAVDDAGHYLYVQQPDICLKAVAEFMATKQ